MNPLIISQFDGDAGTMQTLGIMRDMVNASFLHPLIRDRAARLFVPCNRNLHCEHRNVDEFVRDNFHFLRDPIVTEILADPVTFVEMRLREGFPVFGDCAQMVTYMAALLKSSGHDPKFKAIGTGDYFDHVFISCEGSEIDPTLEPGHAPTHYNKMILVDI